MGVAAEALLAFRNGEAADDEVMVETGALLLAEFLALVRSLSKSKKK